MRGRTFLVLLVVALLVVAGGPVVLRASGVVSWPWPWALAPLGFLASFAVLPFVLWGIMLAIGPFVPGGRSDYRPRVPGAALAADRKEEDGGSGRAVA